MTKIIPVIMCGGAGTRVWPASRETMPKQFIPLLGKLSTFQDTLLRLDPEIFDAPAIVTNYDYRFLVQEQMAHADFELRSPTRTTLVGAATPERHSAEVPEVIFPQKPELLAAPDELYCRSPAKSGTILCRRSCAP